VEGGLRVIGSSRPLSGSIGIWVLLQKTNRHEGNTLLIRVIILASVGLTVTVLVACTSGSDESYAQSLEQWNRAWVLGCVAPLGTDRVDLCNEWSDQLQSLSPPSNVQTGHRQLEERVSAYVQAVTEVELARPTVSNIAALTFPSVWRQMPLKDQYYRCDGSEDFWGYGSTFEAPFPVVAFEQACDAEYAAHTALINARVTLEANLGR
jgi:hypothetical protein